MPITYRFKQRQKDLETAFQKQILTKIWKQKVKGQLRSMNIHDLHDYYDFHRRLDENISKINEKVLSGQYIAAYPLIYTLEKKLGICRHMTIPSPSDALIFQTLIHSFGIDLEKKAPSKQAYYSRDRTNAIKLPHEVNSDYEDWFSKWKIYQNEILSFTETKKFIIVTDLSNYYDSIRLRELRSVISGYINSPEVYLDLTFNIIESLSWKPDYLPSQFIGLPVISIEAIRLLAHSFLYDVDNVLQQQTKNNFVRWMDDIVIGVDDIDEAKEILKCISDVLKSRGLALNMAKTKILTSEDAKKHFLFDENMQLNQFNENNISEKDFMSSFRHHLKNNQQYRYFDKVLKRYLSIGGEKKFNGLLKYIPKLFEEHSELRGNICSYLYKLGFQKKTRETFWKLIKTPRYDDMTLFMLISLTTDWNIPTNKTAQNFITELSKYLKSQKLVNSEFNFYSYLWFAAKYEAPTDLYNHIEKFKNFWIKYSFLTRQVASLLPRLLPMMKNEYKQLSDFIIQRDYSDSSSVIFNMNEIQKEKNIPAIKQYLFPSILHKRGYPLAKFLILYNYCLNPNIVNTPTYDIQDPWFKHWIKHLKSF